MKNSKKAMLIFLASALCLSFSGCSRQAAESTGTAGTTAAVSSDNTKENFCIVASFYPMHILTMNLVQGIDSVTESSMADPNLGCIHDHTFTTEDLKKIEKADVYIENGLGLEAFNEKIKEAYPNTPIIEASAEVSDYVKDGDEIEAHVWTNIESYMQQIRYVSTQLQQLNPENKDAYAANEAAYIGKLEQLKADYSSQLAALSGKKVLVLDETLHSFCLSLNLEGMEIETDHEQESISADQLKKTIEEMKRDNVKTILIAKGDDLRNAEAIARETGAQIYELNSCMTGDVNADAYLNDMKENYEIITGIQ